MLPNSIAFVEKISLMSGDFSGLYPSGVEEKKAGVGGVVSQLCIQAVVYFKFKQLVISKLSESALLATFVSSLAKMAVSDGAEVFSVSVKTQHKSFSEAVNVLVEVQSLIMWAAIYQYFIQKQREAPATSWRQRVNKF